jgi:glutamine kinase
MNIFLLGASRPAHGKKPSALKNIALNTKAMDWQIHSFESVANIQDIHYLGGYHIDEVIKNYPQLNYTVIPNWQNKTVLHTFLKAPFSDQPAIVAYSDTIFRKEIVSDMLSIDADVVFCVDSLWKERFESRPTEDIHLAETIEIENSLVEFTGLIYFKSESVKYLSDLDEIDVGSNLIHLISHLGKNGFSIKPFDVSGHWAEFNSPNDIAQFILGTKAETLARLEPLVRHSHIGKQVSFTCERWNNDSNTLLNEISQKFTNVNLVVRSSSKAEDGWHFSNAGGFDSLLNIDGSDKSIISDAINTVIASYGNKQNSQDQVLIQECLCDVRAAGVVFSCSLESGAPYYRFNFDDKTQSTESVTSGTHNDLRTIIVSRFATKYLESVEPELIPVLKAVEELEKLLGFDKLDVEFAIDSAGLVHIFQVRPITVDHSEYELDYSFINQTLSESQTFFNTQQHPSPFILGNKTTFANMPDWNPAEIIGTRPKPLAFSLYRQLITNDIWAQQRVEYGYRDVRPCPLIFSFSGHPYVDSRASFNSFIPATLAEETAVRLVNAYINIFADNPQYHDKIEFEVVFTVWTPGFIDYASSRLLPYGVTSEDVFQLEIALKEITNKSLIRLHDDIASIALMNSRKKEIILSELQSIDKIFALLDDCKRFGTLAFSHAARAGFVATTWLNNFVLIGVLSDKRRLSFLKSFNTVAGEIKQDKYAYSIGKLSQEKLVDKYGHLRPGTYEITSQAYWEDPERYLFSNCEQAPEIQSDFTFSVSEKNKLALILKDLGTPLSVDEMINYLIKAIQSREFVKFEFTRNLSASLDLCIELGQELNLSRDDLSYLVYSDLEQLKLNVLTIEQLHKQIEIRKQSYVVTRAIELPSIIQTESDFYCFERFTSQPNFVTNSKVEATVQRLDVNEEVDLRGKLVLIPQADPGYDWLFSHGIAGLITQYGGANSHMAIRAAEINLPAAVGVGEKLYEKIENMRQAELDCANHIIREIQ